MLLTVPERILLLNSLPPAEGNAVFLRSVRKLRKDLSFTDEELKDWSVRALPTGFAWDEAKATAVEIEISGTALGYVKRCLGNAEVAGKLDERMLGIYEGCLGVAE